ncbi:MAG: hypothetical protein AAFN81_02310 [Bacteroidota bacterium]
MQLPRWLLIVILALIPLAFLVNLGVQPFIDDEGNRATVALEMIWSGNFITPTLHGEYYYNKPPLWNWILALSIWLHGGASEWAVRFPAVLALWGFAATVFSYFRKHISFERALLVAFMLLTCGRIIMWESLVGLIDLAFSWTIFTLIMVHYHESAKERWGRMFLLTYLLMVVGFMFKGLPAIAFQGITLLLVLYYRKAWKQLFSLAHIGSGLLAVGLIAAYYGIYHQYHSLEEVFRVLFVESGKRTAAAYGWWDTIKHMLNFPIELSYHFLPWTLLLLLLLRKSARLRLRGDDFIRFCRFAFFINIIIYWLSPNFYPRYILMLLPLGFVQLVQLIPDNIEQRDYLYWIIRIIIGLFILVLAAAGLAPIFVDDTQFISGLYWKSGLSFLLLLGLFLLYWKRPNWQYFILVASFMLFRVGFDLLALPPRAVDSSAQRLRDSSVEFAQRWEARELFVFLETHMEPATSYYLQKTQDQMIRRKKENLNTSDYYIFNPAQYHGSLFEAPVDSFVVRHSTSPVYYVGKLRTTDQKEISEKTIGERPGF